MGNTVIKYTYTGNNQNFTVPQFIGTLNFKVWGAGGGSNVAGGFNSYGGPGGFSTGNLNVTAGQTLTIIVGQGGQRLSTATTFGGGGSGGADTFSGFIGSSGGGRSAIRLGTSNTDIITAGGGGGSAGGTAAGTLSNGGAGGGFIGIDGTINTGTFSFANAPGKGGTQVAGGAGGIANPSSGTNGLAGSAFQGGAGGITQVGNAGAGGGGGGGFFGGGGGAGQQTGTSSQDAAGGGGSSFIGPSIVNGSTLNTAQNGTFGSVNAALLRPPQTTDADYITGVGVGSSSSAGGNGLVVISYFQPDLVLNKTVSNSFASVGETLTYTISVKNSGLDTVTNVQFVDTIPNGTTFNLNSLTINGIPSSNNPTPPGFSLGTMSPSQVITVQYTVKIGTTIPTPNPIPNIATASYPGFVFNSNSVATTINSAIVSSSKVVNRSFANVGDILTYTIPIINSGNTTAVNLIFIDTIPNGTSLQAGSFTENGVPVAGSPNPPGVTLNNIGAGRTSTIVFKVKVDTIPNPNPIPNTSSLIFTYTIDPSTIPNRTSSNSSNTNIVNTQINTANLSNIVKYVDKNYADCGDLINYTIVVPNSGNVTAQNIIFRDTIPNGTTFVTNSVYINGNQQVGANPGTGISIPNIAPGSTTTITFSVTVAC